ncbi:MAG: acetate/propionate family kinase [Desulfovibrio sp.]
MKVLVINSGSSSIKYQLFSMENESVLASGLVERIKEKKGRIIHKIHPDTDKFAKHTKELEIKDHRQGMDLVMDALTHSGCGVLCNLEEIDAVGHRVVQGGEMFIAPVLITDDVVEKLQKTVLIAPLHAPANLTGIAVSRELLPEIPQVAIFDTQFHQTMEPKAYLYPVPYAVYKEHGVRKFGFHGTSHKYITYRTAQLLKKDVSDVSLVSIHLGNGCSLAAVKNGECVDTSMGLTPLGGVMMGTRCGDIDPAVEAYLHENTGMTAKEIDTMLNKESGLKGISGMNDMRDIHAAVDEGNERAILALDMFADRVKKFLGAYLAVLGGADAVVFTAGIGENDSVVREKVCAGFEFAGMMLDTEANKSCSGECAVSTADSSIGIWVVPTNEEVQIARETLEVLGK